MLAFSASEELGWGLVGGTRLLEPEVCLVVPALRACAIHRWQRDLVLFEQDDAATFRDLFAYLELANGLFRLIAALSALQMGNLAFFYGHHQRMAFLAEFHLYTRCERINKARGRKSIANAHASPLLPICTCYERRLSFSPTLLTVITILLSFYAASLYKLAVRARNTFSHKVGTDLNFVGVEWITKCASGQPGWVPMCLA